MKKTNNTDLFLSGILGLGACFTMAIVEVHTAHEVRRARGYDLVVPVVEAEVEVEEEVEVEVEEITLPDPCESEYVTCLDEDE